MARTNVMEEVKELRGLNSSRIKEASDAGKKVVGMYCIFSPQEISFSYMGQIRVRIEAFLETMLVTAIA